MTKISRLIEALRWFEALCTILPDLHTYDIKSSSVSSSSWTKANPYEKSTTVRTMKDMADLFFLHHNLFHRGIIQGILMLMIITIMMFKIMCIITWHLAYIIFTWRIFSSWRSFLVLREEIQLWLLCGFYENFGHGGNFLLQDLVIWMDLSGD